MITITNEQIELLERMREAGIVFSIYTGNGHTGLTPREIREYLKDQTAFLANYPGVSVDHYLRWVEHITNSQCPVITRRGTACKGQVEAVYDPSSYISGASDYCIIHRKRV